MFGHFGIASESYEGRDQKLGTVYLVDEISCLFVAHQKGTAQIDEVRLAFGRGTS